MLQHYNKYENNQDHKSATALNGSDILQYISTCRASAIYGLPINLRYIYKRVSALQDTYFADCELSWIAMAPGGLHKMSRWASTMEIVVTFVGGSVVQHLVLTTYIIYVIYVPDVMELFFCPQESWLRVRRAGKDSVSVTGSRDGRRKQGDWRGEREAENCFTHLQKPPSPSLHPLFHSAGCPAKQAQAGLLLLQITGLLHILLLLLICLHIFHQQLLCSKLRRVLEPVQTNAILQPALTVAGEEEGGEGDGVKGGEGSGGVEHVQHGQAVEKVFFWCSE